MVRSAGISPVSMRGGGGFICCPAAVAATLARAGHVPRA